jgi:3-methylfumaryl-CoA hydratase
MTDYQDHVGRTETRHDIADRRRIAWLAATLGVPEPAGALPPAWHWIFFQDWAPPDQTGPDGHPKRGGFLPPVHHLPRRMWAGGRLAFHAAIRPGDAIERTSEILSVKSKSGASGELVFVTVQHFVSGGEGLAIAEEQDIVYRSAEGAAVKPGAAAPEVVATVTQTVTPDPVLLFRYSALTGNSHRIHYDADYVRGVEGYPGLVVHGPLQATWLAALSPGPLAVMSFRGVRPAFHGHPLTLEGWHDGGVFHSRSRDGQGAVCMAAELTLRTP